MKIKTVVAGNGFDGPDFYFCIVDCNQQQYDNGDHYDVVKKAAENYGFEEPMVVFDENDNPKGLFDLFVWESADTFVVDTN